VIVAAKIPITEACALRANGTAVAPSEFVLAIGQVMSRPSQGKRSAMSYLSVAFRRTRRRR
jgi:hypothetical protein